MKDKYFLDTNIFVYTFDSTAPAKKKQSEHLVQNAISSNHGITSYQVVQEFLNVSIKKFVKPLSLTDTKRYIDIVFVPLCQVYPSVDLYKTALDIAKEYQFSFYDSLIVASALHADCKILYTEDLQNDQKIFGLKIKNPFHS